MKRRVLIVHPDADMVLTIEGLLNELSKVKEYDLSFQHAKSRGLAEEKTGSEPIDLVVTALEIAANAKSPVGAGGQHRLGMELVRTLRSTRPALRAIIVTGEQDDDVLDFAQTPGTRLVQEGETFAMGLKSMATELLGPHQADVRQRVVLSISLFNEKARCVYQFQSQSEGGWPRTAQPLDIEPGRLMELVEDSRVVHIGDPTWEHDLKNVGEKLADELFQPTAANLAFRDDFNQWVGRVGIENIRVRFTVEDLLHPIAVEALKQRRKGYWMLQTAVFRGQELCGGAPGNARPGLFQDEATSMQPVNFLIIEANVPPNATVKEGTLDLMLKPLPKLAQEVKAVGEKLSNLKRDGQLIGEVRVIKQTDVPPGGSFKAFVKEVLTREPGKWHVLHYAGHTHYDSQHRVGYLFLPGSGGIKPVEPVRIAEFALWLGRADTRFVFLSSCQSAGHDFIYQLAKERVPAIMGFLWKVDDEKAREYAESFYEHLFDGRCRSLEYACLAAKKDMHAACKDNPIWASPVLVTQVSV